MGSLGLKAYDACPLADSTVQGAGDIVLPLQINMESDMGILIETIFLEIYTLNTTPKTFHFALFWGSSGWR